MEPGSTGCALTTTIDFTDDDAKGAAAAAPELETAGKLLTHEDAAHEKRNWVRLTYECNDNCIFCLDSDTHDGEMRGPEEVKAQILDGRRKGAERLILSGGEPTIHPRFVDFVRLGRLAGYPWIQTVTNGRMFRYREFLKRSVDAGLNEITFSIHGHNAKIHDALVGVKGAFEQEVEGLRHALDDGRVVVNIDVCVNRGNVRHIDALIRTFYEMGVKEYDLLHVIPFGRAYTDGRDTLFYDLDEMTPQLREAFAWSKRPDVHLWLNRFPVPHCEGFEELIQDPYKLNDEIRGRREEYGKWIREGVALDCREPTRCGYCYLEDVCDTFEGVFHRVTRERRFETLRIDTEWEAKQGPVFGGDPASSRRSKDEHRHLPLHGRAEPIEYLSLEQMVRASGIHRLRIVAPSITALPALLERFPEIEALELELEDYRGLASALEDGALGARRLLSCLARTEAQAEELLAIDVPFEVVVALRAGTRDWLLERGAAHRDRLAIRQLSWERLSESQTEDVDLPAFFSSFEPHVPVEGVPACVLGRMPRTSGEVLDAAMLLPSGELEIFRYVQRYVLDHYHCKSLRCAECVHAAGCRGMHVNYIRAHGFSAMQPIVADASLPEAAAPLVCAPPEAE